MRAVREIGRPSILKTRRFGYDGKGQTMIREGSDLGAVHRALGGGPMILEGFVAFEREVSVIAARSLEGAVAAYDLCENEHERHILARTRVPARVAPALEPAARDDRREGAGGARLCRRDRRRDVLRARRATAPSG